jgi:hypothetical protein
MTPFVPQASMGLALIRSMVRRRLRVLETALLLAASSCRPAPAGSSMDMGERP